MDTAVQPRALPQIGTGDVIRALLSYSRDPLATLRWLTDRYDEDVICARTAGQRIVLLRRADHAEQVLKLAGTVYTKVKVAYEDLGRVVGKGLLTSENPLWRQQRLMMAPIFHRRCLDGFAATMQAVARDTTATLLKAAEQQRSVDLLAQMRHATLRVLGLTLMSVDLSNSMHRFSQAVELALQALGHRIHTRFKVPRWMPTPSNMRLTQAVRVLDAEVFGIIEARRRGAQAAVQNDLLGLLMAASEDDGGKRMSNRQLRDEVMTMLTAGHETTASTLAWCLWLLSKHSDIEDAVRIELQQVLQGREVAADDLSKLELTRSIVKETLRLYPTLPIVARQAERDALIGDFHIPAGSSLLLSPYLIQRDRRYWRDPERFDPTRFMPGGEADSRPRGAYLPFIDGPRRCIGEQFALMEIGIFLATILPRISLRRDPACRMAIELSVTLRPDNLSMYPMAVSAASGD